jgi:hypothetical protein
VCHPGCWGSEVVDPLAEGDEFLGGALAAVIRWKRRADVDVAILRDRPCGAGRDIVGKPRRFEYRHVIMARPKLRAAPDIRQAGRDMRATVSNATDPRSR